MADEPEVGPSSAAVAAALEGVLSEGATFALTGRGFAAKRSQLDTEGFRRVERLLSARPVRVFDFNLGPEDAAASVHPEDGFQPRYAGTPGPLGGTIFRADHHFPIEALREESTTPLVRRWLLSLHEHGCADVLAEVAAARYLVNHWDVDILFSQHLGDRAQDRAYLETVGAKLAGAALRNDYLREPPAFLQPGAGRAYFAGLGIEVEVTAGTLTFDDALTVWVPALGRWLEGRAQADEAERLERWEEEHRGGERRSLDRIDAWKREGRMSAELEGRLWVLEAPERIDNANLFLYLRERQPLAGPRVQLLSYPAGQEDKWVYKLRAHGGFDLNPVFEKLRGRVPEASFGGRSAAGGSRPVAPCADEILPVLREQLTANR